ncbi:MAG TPA: hypothetical protein VHG51_01395 [Longimicrobiaceae bacterium]|nr:hypothetical protein [Longimicrobiaceae bacterium]
MAEILERDDLSLYVVAGVPRSFQKKLRGFVEQEAKADGEVLQVDHELSEWMLAQLRDEKRPRGRRTPASRALWRAYSALSAARYYLADESEEEDEVRRLRARVEELWREVSPMFAEEGEEQET